MYTVQIGDYCFSRMYLWLQYSSKSPQFTEVVIEVFYPSDRQAEGLVMFSHGFLIGFDYSFYPKLLLSKLAGADTPLYQISPSEFYNYSEAAMDKHWAVGFVTACHEQIGNMPWTDFQGNPRVGQEAYAAASYLVRYGVTYKYDDKAAVSSSKFLKSEAGMHNRVIFAGHSVGGAHAQAAATGFDNLQAIGKENWQEFDPVFYNREVCPAGTPPMSGWESSKRANPVGLLQLSPVDNQMPILFTGMEPYRRKLATISLPNLMVVGQCDSACLKSSSPPAWVSESDSTSQFAQMAPAGTDSTAAICMVEKGSHSGYLSHENDLCSQADNTSSECEGCKGVQPYLAGKEEFQFTNELMKRFIDQSSSDTPVVWRQSPFIKWLDTGTPEGTSITLKKFSDGYVHFAGPASS